jgi:hypothetical protein
MTDEPKQPPPRPNVPEPTIPLCGNCQQPLNRCRCKDNDLKK